MRMSESLRVLPVLAGLLVGGLTGCATGPQDPPADLPGAGTPEAFARGADSAAPGLTSKWAAGEDAMVASAHPLATRVGLEVLRGGGNAVDAAVATAFALGVVEPMMAGIGGSGGMLIWLEGSDGERGRAEYLDYYAIAPRDPDLTFPAYDGPNHTPRGVAVPGTVPGLLEALERHGTMDRERILAPAIQLAEEGFPVSPLLARTIEGDSVKLNEHRRSGEIFWPGGRPLGPGEALIQPELAATMRKIAEEGPAGFTRGEVAEEIVRVLNDGGNPMTTEDLAAFSPRWRRPVCGEYRDRVVLSAPPPQSGMQIVGTLNLLAPHDLGALGHPVVSDAALHTLATAIRSAAGDRRTHLADPDQVGVPARGLTSSGFADLRAGQVGPGSGAVPTRVPEADPWPFEDDDSPAGCLALDPFAPTLPELRPAPDEREIDGVQGEVEHEPGETTHLSVVDAAGNAVSLTFTQGVYFGTGAWAAGTFLNSGLFIFAEDGPNAIAPGKAPASTTTPTILLNDDRVEMVVGSPGGGRIPPAVIQAIVYVVDYGMSPIDALSMPRINPHFSEPVLEFEQGIPGEVLAAMRTRGWVPRVYPPLSLHFGGVQMIWRDGTRWIGAADPRRDGSTEGY